MFETILFIKGVFRKYEGWKQLNPYSKSAAPIDRLYYSLLNEEGTESFRGFGIFYDNPRKVKKSSLRSEGGNILDTPDAATLKKPEGKYNIKTYPERDKTRKIKWS